MEKNKVMDDQLETIKENEAGLVQIADDVIAVIAEIAALEVEGTAGIGGKHDLVQTIRGKKASKGIKVEVDEDRVYVDVLCILNYGVKIKNVCLKIQQKVKNAIETMTGLAVESVNVHVVGVAFQQPKNTEEY